MISPRESRITFIKEIRNIRSPVTNQLKYDILHPSTSTQNKKKTTTTTKQKHSDKKQQIMIKYKSLAAYNIMFPIKKLSIL